MPDHRHPLYQVPRPIYWVPPMDNLAAAINAGIEFNRHGISVLGLGRIGKSEALKLLARTLHWRAFDMSWGVVLPGIARATTEAYFFSQVGLQQKLKIRETSNATFVIDHVANHLCEMASRAGAQIIVLGIDDSNRLGRDDYNHLVTLDNHLAARGCRLFVVLVVQEDADQSSVPLSDPEPHPSQITGRFTSDTLPYFGLQNSREIEVAFKNFLNQAWNNKTYLEEFAPTLHRNGWLTADLAAQFWLETSLLRGKHRLTPDAPFPMQCFDPASYYLFGRVAAEDPKLEAFTSEQVQKALALSGLIELERSRRPRDLQ